MHDGAAVASCFWALGRRGGAFNVAVRELLNFYVAMEEFVMEEDIHKAMSIREHAPGSLTTSMVGVPSLGRQRD